MMLPVSGSQKQKDGTHRFGTSWQTVPSGQFPVSKQAVFAIRLAFGEMGDALLLASARVEPTRLLATGYPFRHPTLEGALRHLLSK